ncbi:hypothetical protein M0R45_007692 [Rubus argutus]|uniref:Protein kinase domain-containing protein n=1 Tax=Rubus argutus TaxID=59490 RepID=A0AAW1Y2D3_RUBAR
MSSKTQNINSASGSIAEELGMIEHLVHLDLSNNFFNGSLPKTILNASELQVLSLSNNVISGELPESIGDLKRLQLLNISDNALAGKVPENLTSFAKPHSSFFKKQSALLEPLLQQDLGKIPAEFAKKVSVNSTIDLSFNNLTGAIPDSQALLNQKTELFAGNGELCGKPLKNLCPIPSTLSTPPNVTTTSSSPAIAAIPKTLDSNPQSNTSGATNGTQNKTQTGLKPVTITGIVVGDLAGIAIIGLVILYVYHVRKKSKNLNPISTTAEPEKKSDIVTKIDPAATKPSSWSCLTIEGEETSEATSSDSDHDEQAKDQTSGVHSQNSEKSQKGGVLVTVDGEPELELETLLKASAYVLGASGPSIVYKAVLEDKTALAVRRIGESVVEKMRDFENQVRAIAKMRHPNLVRLRGFYWGDDEKLVIYDYVSNGSLAGTINRKAGNMISHKGSGSARGYFGSLKSGTAREGLNDVIPPIAGSPVATSSSSAGGALSPYQAPESLKNLKPNPSGTCTLLG